MYLSLIKYPPILPTFAVYELEGGFMATRIVLALLIGVMAPSAWGYEFSPVYPGASSSYKKNPIPIEQEMTAEGFYQKIVSAGVETLEESISLLPRNMTDGNFVLMYRSRSLQHASPDQPRALVFSPSARFVVTYNGGHNQMAGHNTLEVVQFNDQTFRFDFFEIVFQKGIAPKLSNANPAKCLSCHQSQNRQFIDMRPNWEPYNFWPGALGSFSLSEDKTRSIRDDRELMSRLQAHEKDFVTEQTQEGKFLDHFLDVTQKTQPRYQALSNLGLRSPVRLNQSLGELSFLRMSRLILEEKSIFASYKHLIWSFLKCPLDRGAVTEPILMDHMQFLERLAQTSFAGLSPTHSIHSVDRLVTGIFEPLGVDTSDWSMDFRTQGRFAVGHDRFGLPGKSDEALLSALRYVLKKSDLETWTELESQTCQELAESAKVSVATFLKSPEALARVTRFKERPQITPEQILNQCMNCHDGSDGFIPRLKLNDANWLSGNLRKTGFKRGTLLDEILYRTGDLASRQEQMPPAMRLNRIDRQNLEAYLLSTQIGR